MGVARPGRGIYHTSYGISCRRRFILGSRHEDDLIVLCDYVGMIGRILGKKSTSSSMLLGIVIIQCSWACMH